MVKRIAGSAFVLVSLLPAVTIAGWNAHGPYGGQIYAVLGAGDTLLIGTDDGIYRSTNAGVMWERFGDLPRGTRVSSLAVSPADPEVMLAGGASYRTVDGGAHWTPLATAFEHAVFSPLAPQNVIATNDLYDIDHTVWCSNDGGVTFEATGVEAAAVAADFASNAFIAIDASSGSMYKSTDATSPCAAPWTAVGAAHHVSAYALFQNPLDSDIFFITTRGLDANYFYRYDRAHDTSLEITSNGGIVFADLVQPGRLWLSGVDNFNGGCFLDQSIDGGITWPSVASDLARAVLATDSVVPDTLYGSDAVGFSVSFDAGLTWESRTQGVPLVRTAAVSIRADRPDETLAAGPNGVAISTDRGLTWSPAETSPAENVDVFARSPTDATVVYAGAQWHLFRSTDAGRNWQPITPPGTYATFASIEFDALDPARMSAVRNDQIAWSEDAGASWTEATIEGGGSADFRHLAHNPNGTGIVYALAFLHNDVYALFRASAHGQPLVAVAPDLPLNALAVNPSNDRMLFAVAHDETYRMATGYLSVDAGDHWLPRATFASDPAAERALRFDPCDGRTVYMQGYNALYVSHDLGLTWLTEQAELPVGIVNDIDVSCSAGMLSIAAATQTRGAEVRDPEFVDAILADGFDGD